MSNGKRGRPVVQEGVQKPRSVKLSDDNVELAKRIGEGNMTLGIRMALEAYNSPERY